ncbi:MAG: hypothetical protein SFZ24_02790 [Planctomycetota bacterium]|nr:hypothetical protein [Planctomycetota bacterium]
MRCCVKPLFVLLAGSWCVSIGTAAPLQVQVATPDLDRWVYPFDSAPGFRESASVFGSIGQENACPPLSFDQRDGQMLLGWDLRSEIPTGRGLCGYRILGVTVTLTTATQNAFRYDPTYDGRTSYPGPDTDQGRPIELYGAAFRNGWTVCPLDSAPANNAFPCYFEGTPSQAAPPFGPAIQSGVRHAFATDYAGGVERDVSNNVRDGFDPSPFAVGQIAGLAAGALVPADRDVTFVLDVVEADVQGYLRRALNGGQLRLMVTSLQPASGGTGGCAPGSGSYASFYCKEIGLEGLAARLSITVQLTAQGDTNADGAVDFQDITAVLQNWSGGGPSGDANCDGVVTFADIAEVLRGWN